jgi:hypothetical protein
MATRYYTQTITFKQDQPSGTYTKNLSLPADGRQVVGVTLLDRSSDAFELEIQKTRGQTILDMVPKEFFGVYHNTSSPLVGLNGWQLNSDGAIAQVRLPQAPASDVVFTLVFQLED